MADQPLDRLADFGQSVWLDALSRKALTDGGLERMLGADAVVGITSNPSIFEKAMAEGDAYDEQLREVLKHDDDPKEIFLALAHRDITDACDLLRPIWDGGSGRDGYVSWEVDPRFAHDTDRTVAEARRLHAMVDRPNLLVKIPATDEGVPAITTCIAAGIPVNVTLIFGLERHKEVIEAYLAGLDRCADPSKVASVASFFVSRVDTEADGRLADHPELQGKLAIANAKLAYQLYLEAFSGDRWEALKAKGASPQRCLWASTSTKNPAYRDVVYVEQLIGRETVNTMPIETAAAFQDHGEVRETLTEGVEEAHSVFDALCEAGVDVDDVIAVVEREGVEKFAKSFDDLIAGITAKRDAMVAA